MTDKRFVSEDDCCGYYTEIIDNEKELDLLLPNPKKNLTIEELVDLLNDLYEENQSLKYKNGMLSDELSLLYDVCIGVGCDRDSYRKDITSWVNDYIQDHTIKVDKLPVYGNDELIYQLPNKLEYIYFKKKWECIGKS